MVVRYYAGHSCTQIGRDLHVDEETVSRWVHRFVDGGLDGLRDEARSGRPAMYTVDEVSLLIQTALTSPQELGLPFGSWTLDRLQAYVQSVIPLKAVPSTLASKILLVPDTQPPSNRAPQTPFHAETASSARATAHA